MRLSRKIYFFFLSFSPFLVTAQQTTKGTDFWVGYMTHSNGITSDNPPRMSLYITAEENTKGEVNIGNILFNTFTVSAGQITTVDIPQSAYINAESIILKKGINVKSEKTVSVFSHIYAQNRSGATLALPTEALGKKYFAMSYDQSPAGTIQGVDASGVFRSYSFLSTIMIVAPYDNTTVSIKNKSGVPFQISLNKGDVYEIQSTNDLTGTVIESIPGTQGACYPVAVFSGSSGVQIIPDCLIDGSIKSIDNIFQQLAPVSAWGKEFVAVPFASREANVVYRVLASTDNTTVYINGSTETISKAGSFIEFRNTSANYIKADNPVCLAQFQQSMDCETIPIAGDPEMIIIPPIEQSINNVSLLSTVQFRINTHFINVIIRTAETSSFRIDNELPKESFKPVAFNPEYSYIQENVLSGSHVLTSGKGFVAVAYGMGLFESYAYSAGNSVKNLQLPPVPIGLEFCEGQPSNLNITLPFQASQIVWSLDDGASITQDNPSGTTQDTSFVYNYPGNPVQLDEADHVLHLIIKSPSLCDPVMEADYIFDTRNGSPAIQARNVDSVCFAAPVNLAAYVSPKGGIFLGSGVRDSLFYPEEGVLGINKIRYQFTTASGCIAYKDFDVNVLNYLAVNAGTDKELDLGESVTLDATYTGDNATFSWQPTAGLSNPNILNPQANPTDNTTYILTISKPAGCSASDTVSIVVLSDLKAPNAFSPNGDGVNDLWLIKGLTNYPKAEIKIYNRLGQQVYYSDSGIPWDGTTKGKSLPSGIYYYIINPRSTKTGAINGYVTILR